MTNDARKNILCYGQFGEFVKMHIRSVIFCLLLILTSFRPSEAAAANENSNNFSPLWSAPKEGCILVEPEIGYSEGSDISGTTLSLSGFFTFRYFLVGLRGLVVFSASGPLYDMSLDLNLRYGPIYLGASVVGHWYPGDSNEMKPGAAANIGIHIPLPIDGLFLDIGYRPVFVFLKSRSMLYHVISCGVVFELGT